MTQASANLHLMWRAGFGPSLADIRDLGSQSPRALYKQMQKASEKAPVYLEVAGNMFEGLLKGVTDEGRLEQLTKEQKQQLRKQSQEDLRSLNMKWLSEMVHSPASLREKMSLFWHGHFACRDINIFNQQQLLDAIRRNALGNFGDLLREVSMSASMLSFLNNQQNRKQQPNENFAREVMELFTLGRGHYSEQDIKEAARAFTGWGFNLRGEFVFRRNLHDDGFKTVLGKTGRFTGEDVLGILLEQKQTARFITGKIYRYFVQDEPDIGRINVLADRFHASGYDISRLMEDIFTSAWFYSDQYLGGRIKSPVELLIGLQRLLPMEFERPEVQLLFQRLLGQVLFHPPNVAGWPGGKNWIDSSSLMYRLRIPRILHDDDNLVARPKDDDDSMMGVKNTVEGSRSNGGHAGGKGMMNVDIHWSAYADQFRMVHKDHLAAAIASVLLPAGMINLDTILKYTERDSREDYIRSLTIGLMSLPEYQMS